MKTEKLFSRIGRTALLAATLLAAPVLTGCSSESDAPDHDSQQKGEPGVHIYFGTPAMTVGTRAHDIDGDNISVSTDEAAIKSLWLYVFSVNGTSSTLAAAYDCTDRIKSFTDVTDWRTVNFGDKNGDVYEAGGLPIAGGTYRFYMVANLDKYLSDANVSNVKPDVDGDISGLTGLTEQKLQELSLTVFTADEPAKLTTTNGLPMGMYCTEVKTGSSAESATTPDDGNITISASGADVNIYCDMTFLCSAVRYTFLYDKNSFSWDVKKFVVTGDKVTFRNLNNSYQFKNNYSCAGTNNSLDYTAKYYEVDNSSSFINAPIDLTKEITAETAATKNAYAFQGTAYLPSNYAPKSSGAYRTSLEMKCDVSAGPNPGNTYTIQLPKNTTETSDNDVLARGYFYDIIGKISSTGIEWHVHVKDWKNGNTQVEPL